MDNNENKLNDYQEQYDILVEEEQEKQKKKAFWIMFFCLIIILFSVLGATYSYYRIYINSPERNLNIDTDKDGKPDLNVDINGDGICDINCDTDGDGKPDLNIDYRKDLKAHFNLDLDGDGKPDTNLINQSNGNSIACNLNGICDLNCDTDGDHHPNINIDLDGDGKPDINIDTDCDGKADINIDTNGDGKPDLNIDTDGDGKPDKNVDGDGDGVCDLNCDDKNPTPDPPTPGVTPPKDPIIEVKPGDENENAILFVTYVQGVNVNNMIPNTTVTQTFTVENQSNQTLRFNLNWVEVFNEITVQEGFTYTLKRDGIVQLNSLPVPNTDSNLLKEIIIPAKTTYEYEIDYTFHDLADVDQTMDQNKTFTAKIKAEIVQ